MTNELTHVWRIRLFADGWYDGDGQLHRQALGERTHTGTADEAKEKARNTRVGAADAEIERIAVILPNGRRVPFGTDEIYSFSIGLY